MTAVETVAAIRAALEEAGREYRARVDDILDAVLAELSPAPSTMAQSVLDVADRFDRLAARHPDSETGQVEIAAAHEIRRAIAAHIDTTPKEAGR